jgi:hypothetical protein
MSLMTAKLLLALASTMSLGSDLTAYLTAKLLLTLASTVVLGSENHRTNEHHFSSCPGRARSVASGRTIQKTPLFPTLPLLCVCSLLRERVVYRPLRNDECPLNSVIASLLCRKVIMDRYLGCCSVIMDVSSCATILAFNHLVNIIRFLSLLITSQFIILARSQL